MGYLFDEGKWKEVIVCSHKYMVLISYKSW